MIDSSKYKIIWKSLSEPNIVTKSDSEYASFLKNLERTCNKTGYLDSKFYTQKFNSLGSNSDNKKSDRKTVVHPHEIARYRNKFSEDYEKQMKRISKALLEEKRKERLLKRREGDIVKKEHVLNKSLFEFDSEINSKKFQQDLQLNETGEELEKIQKKFYYDKSKTIKERMRKSVFSHVEKAGKLRQADMNVSKLIREFNAKKNELDVNAKDISNLMHEFEIQLRREENKHKKLQSELENYSLALRREIIKNKTQQEQIQRELEIQQKTSKEDEDKLTERSLSLFLNHSDNGIKAAELERKTLDGQLNKMANEHSVKICEYGGSLNTIRNKLRECENTQRQLIENANYYNLILKNNKNKNKIEEVNSRKLEMANVSQNELIKKRTENEEKYFKLSTNRHILMDLENMAENTDHLKETVRRDKENEKKYFKNMNDTSKDIKQLSTTISRLSKQLHDTKVLNSSRINEEKRSADKLEQQMEEELNRLKTQLIELQTKRNNHCIQLTECRKYLKGDQYQLQKTESAQSRLNQIKEKGDQVQPFLPNVV